MKKNIFVLGLLLVCCSCNDSKVMREQVLPAILNGEIYTTMPGDLLLVDDYVVWSDPFSSDYFLHVMDGMTGEEIGVMGKMGQGPFEFVTPMVSALTIDNKIRAIDVNGTSGGYFSIDSLLKYKEPLIEYIPFSEEEKQQGMNKLDDGIYIGNTENDNSDYFCLVTGDNHQTTFGNYPIKEIHQHIGGSLTYDRTSGLLAFAAYDIPYIALYEKEEDTFITKWEVDMKNVDYEIIDDRLNFDRKRTGINALCMTKDYIVTLQRDYSTDNVDETAVGRDASKCTHTVFLYDYNSELKKIVDLGMPIIRIAADRRSNTLYAIGVNPDFVLAKYELK